MPQRSRLLRMLTGPLSPVVLALPLLWGCASAAQPANCPSADSAASKYNGPPWPQSLDHTSTPETHRKAVADLFDAMKMDKVLKIALDSTVKMQIEANPKLRRFESVMRRFMGKYLSLDGIREPMTQLYVDRFSELEIVQLAAFYRTPLGERTLIELPKIMEEGSKMGLQQVQMHMKELDAMIREQLMKDGVPVDDD